MNGTHLGPLVRQLRNLVEAQETRGFDDAQLLEQFASGRDEAAFAALMHRHGGLVWRVCRQVLRQEQDAEDAFQASFLVLALKAASLRRERGLGNWLYGVAYRMAMNARRKATRRQMHEKRKAAATPQAQPAAEALHELQASLHEEIARLPAKYRIPLVLCGLEGKSKSEAAQELGWKEGTVSGRLARARQMLQGRLARRGIMLSAAWAATTLSLETSAAAIPSKLVWATSKAARQLAIHKTLAAGIVSNQVAALMKGALRAMTLTKLKLALTLALGASLSSICAGMAAYAAFANEPTPARPERQTRASDAIPVPQAKQRVDLDGDPLPEGAIARLGTERFRHDDVEAMALSPDGQVLVTNSRSGGTLRAWEAESGKLLWRIAPAGMVSATFSPDGLLLAEVCDCRSLSHRDEMVCVFLRDAKNGRVLHRFPAEGGLPFTIWDAFFSPDGKVVGINDEGTIRLWSTQTGRPLAPWASAIPATAAIRFSSDGKSLVAALNGNTVSYWNVAKGMKTRTLELKGKETYWYETMSDDGRLLAVAAGHVGEVRPFGTPRTTTLQLFDTTTGKERCTFQGDTSGIAALVLSRDGHTLIGVSPPTDDKLHTISAWNTTTGKLEHRFVIRLAHSWRVGVTPDGKKLYTSTTNNHGWLAHGAEESVVRWWDVATGKELMAKPAHTDRVHALGFTSDGRYLLSAANDGTMRLWDVASGRSLHCIADEGRSATVPAIVSCRGTFLSGGRDDKLRLYDWIASRSLQSFAPPPEPHRSNSVIAFVVSADGRRATSYRERWRTDIVGGCSAECVFDFWDLSARKIRKTFIMPENVRFSQFLPDGKRFIGVTRATKEVVVVDIETGQTEATLYHGDREFMKMATAADGRFLVTAASHASKWEGQWVGIGPHAIHVWELCSAKERLTIRVKDSGTDDHCNRIALAPDCRTLATVSQGSVLRFWDAMTGEELPQRMCAPSPVTSLTFSPDSKLLATGHADSTILLWDLSSSRPHDRSPVAKADVQQLAAAWEDLASSDAHKAHRAVARLIAAGDSATAFLRTHLLPASPAGRSIAGLIADLDHDRFERREKASAELEGLLPQVEPALRNALAQGPPLEVRRRIEYLLAVPARVALNGQTLQAIRGVEVLERIATTKACDLIEHLAAGAPEARLTREAKAAVERFGKGTTLTR